MKVLVCGGREYLDSLRLGNVLDRLDEQREIATVIHGAARGADSLAGEWARQNGAQEVRCPANWDVWGRSAGHIRNKAMLELKPDLVVSFPGGVGTAMMTRLAREAGVEVLEIT